MIRGDIVQSLCTSLSRAPEVTLRDLEPLTVFCSEHQPIIVDELEQQFRKSFGPEQLHSLSNVNTRGEALVRTRPYSALVAIKEYLEEALGDDGMELDGEFLVRENEVTAF